MSQPPNTDVPSDIAKRITSAADQLYEENGRVTFPNVDTVRRKARVNMNDASAVMRVWRRTQTASATPLQASIPDLVQGASQALLVAVWTAATEAANSSLQLAQAGWEQERTEAEACRQQLANAFDSQSEELASIQRHVENIEKRLAAHADELQAINAKTEDLKKEAAAADAKAATAEARAKELAQRADDLRAELSRAHASADQQRQGATQLLEAAEATIRELRQELTHKSAAENEVRQEMAYLRGRAEAMAAERQIALAQPEGKVDGSSKRPAAAKTKTPNGA